MSFRYCFFIANWTIDKFQAIFLQFGDSFEFAFDGVGVDDEKIILKPKLDPITDLFDFIIFDHDNLDPGE